MGILEIHFHDSELSWTANTGTGKERSLSLGTGSESQATADEGETVQPSVAPKLRSFAVIALVVGAGIAFNRLRSRRARKTAESETESQGRRLSLSRSK